MKHWFRMQTALLKVLMIGVVVLGLLVSAIGMAGTSNDFRSSSGAVSFLGYLRHKFSDLYHDFVVRYEALEFFEHAQGAIDTLHFDGSHIEGLEYTVYDTSSGDFETGDVDLLAFSGDLRRFIKSYPRAKLSILQALQFELSREALLDGLRTGLVQQNIFRSAREIMKAPEGEQLASLSKLVGDLSQVPGIDPKRLGINKEFLTGQEYLTLYKDALEGRFNTTRLLWLAVLAQKRGELDGSLEKAENLFTGIETDKFISALQPASYKALSDELVTVINTSPMLSSKISESRLRKLFKDAYGTLKNMVMPFAEQKGKPVIVIRRGHPYELWLRGGVGDCSTFNSFAMSLASKEEMYWILRPNGVVKGYLQYTRLKVDGIDSLYVNTISGSDISRADVRRALLALSQSLAVLKAEKIIIPVPEKFKDIINFPEVAFVLNELAASGKRVKLDYLDAQDRKDLAPFIEGSLDLPETNQFGIEINSQELANAQIKITHHQIALRSADLFPKISKQEMLLIALDLKNRNAPPEEISKVLEVSGISGPAFSEIWNLITNQEGLPVAKFHEKLKEKLTEYRLPVNWNELIHSAIMFRGHFAAPDAAIGDGFGYAMEYLRIYLLAYTDLPHVYQILTPHFNKLVEKSEFRDLIRTLFRKNIKEFDRPLDVYEIEHRSAYKTLIDLFAHGLTTTSFEPEIEQLKQPWENKQDVQLRKDGVLVRRLTLLAGIHGYRDNSHDLLMEHLNEMVSAGRFLEEDDTRTIAQHFSLLLKTSELSEQKVRAINDFLSTTALGLSIGPSLGMFSIPHLDVPRIFNALIGAGKPLWAAYLIHKDPWQRHEQAAQWVAQLWKNRSDIGHGNFLMAMSLNAEWLTVPGVNSYLDALMLEARDNIGNETAMTRILVKHPEKLTNARIHWLAQTSNEHLAEFILKSVDGHWPIEKVTLLRKNLSITFPQLFHKQKCGFLLGLAS